MSQRSKDDADLIGRACALGDAAAFGRLVDRYRARVYSYLLQLCRNPSDADDLAQDTFLRAWDKLATFRHEGSFEGWLLRIAYTTFLQSYRRHGAEHRRRVDLPDGVEPVDETANSMDGEWPDLPRLLESVEPDIRTMLILSYGYGYTTAEISEVVGMPAGTVKSHISRAKSRIRSAFEIDEVANARTA